MSVVKFDGELPGWNGHVTEVVTYTVDTDISPPLRVLYPWASGNVRLQLANGGNTTIKANANERIDWLAIKRVISSGTTVVDVANNLIGYR